MLYQLSYRTVMPAGFEPALFRTRALIWRLRPLGHGITKLFCLYSLSKNVHSDFNIGSSTGTRYTFVTPVTPKPKV
jgi:hypothetical protein